MLSASPYLGTLYKYSRSQNKLDKFRSILAVLRSLEAHVAPQTSRRRQGRVRWLRLQLYQTPMDSSHLSLGGFCRSTQLQSLANCLFPCFNAFSRSPLIGIPTRWMLGSLISVSWCSRTSRYVMSLSHYDTGARFDARWEGFGQSLLLKMESSSTSARAICIEQSYRSSMK